MRNAMDWYYDEGLAKAGAGDYITESGSYVGVFTHVLHKVSAKGTVGFEFEFKSYEGQRVKYITIWVKNKDGELLPGWSLINSLMGLMRSPVMNRERMGTDRDNNLIEGYPFLCDKSVGVILQKEFYTKSDGSTGYQFNILHFVDATTKKTQTEALNNREAKVWYRKVEDKIRDGVLPKSAPQSVGQSVLPPSSSLNGGFGPDNTADDNLPF
ncbi:MAG: hypothetical protein LBU70_05325 [Chitinispirillales bacterium]|jgi:hypothetical protein|nr:hypothetical protein [Chitinispirillales bacterium]